MDKKYLEKIYRLYHKEIYIYLLSLCKDHYLAEDLVNDTFFKALVSIDNYSGNMKYYLFRVGKNLWIDWVRKNTKLNIKNLDDINLNASDDILSEVITNERNQDIYKSILRLSQSYKEVIVLYYYCDFSLKEIAKTMGISNGAARTLLYRSRKRLKEILEEENYEF